MSWTLGVEVTNISAHGFWIFDEADQQEAFLSFKDCPWFVGATVGQIRDVQRQGKTVLHWPALDVDLDIDLPAGHVTLYRGLLCPDTKLPWNVPAAFATVTPALRPVSTNSIGPPMLLPVVFLMVYVLLKVCVARL